ncbi:aspartyl protease family protein [Mucilaginibacter sp. HMF5004]|uniref:aspartyl protease family protein n=1 Tax=Mucilaginibacter rivuli TaxID=2857527 RepID=UPI001C5EB702|nr:aspartyl protease family protein [Mucilaginibacter rivuli]MBW4890830.1 aspartyl protease family protein [Mucilaginibacter rivuli]
MTEIPLQIIDLEDDGFHPLVEVVVFGKTHTVVLDTGASRTAFDKSILFEANNEAAFRDSEKLSTGLGTNTMTSATLLLHDLHIGTLHIPDFEVAVLDLSTINVAYRQLNLPLILGVLGGDVLMKYEAVIDYGKRVLLLKDN